MDTFVPLLSEVLVCVLLLGFCWVDRGQFLVHTGESSTFLVQQKHLCAPTQSSKINTTQDIKSTIIIVVVVLMNNLCLAF